MWNSISKNKIQGLNLKLYFAYSAKFNSAISWFCEKLIYTYNVGETAKKNTVLMTEKPHL